MDIRYVAGLIDGEGCMRLGLGKYGSLQVVLTVGMTNELIVRSLYEQFGGSLRSVAAKNKHRAIWYWAVHGYTALDVIQQLLPHLVVKKPEAELIIEATTYRDSLPKGHAAMRCSARTPDQIAKLSWYHKECMRLKKV